jgi:hypothetical protein
MSEIPNQEKQNEPEIEKIPEDKPEIGEESSWSKDQQEKSYYYDDDHGYEKYNPDEEEE